MGSTPPSPDPSPPDPAQFIPHLLHERDGLVVVDKPAPMIVHPTGPGRTTTLYDYLQDLLAFEIANGGQISIINRLDRETSGVTLVATLAETARALSIAMGRRAFTKTYLALVLGHPEEDRFTIDQPLRRKGEFEESPIWVKQAAHPDGSPATTHFEVLSRHHHPHAGAISLVQATPETGRMHQIRVHLALAGHPVVGDKIYGADESCYLDFIETGWTEYLRDRLHLRRQALHCTRMSLDPKAIPAGDGSALLHPPLAWESPLPPDLAAFLAEAPAFPAEEEVV